MPLAALFFKQFQKKLQVSFIYLKDDFAERAQNSENFFVVRAGLLNIVQSFIEVTVRVIVIVERKREKTFRRIKQYLQKRTKVW